MYEMTPLEKIYKYLYEKNINPDDLDRDELSRILEGFDGNVFENDPVQSLSKDIHVYSEDLFIKTGCDIAVVRRPRYRPHNKFHKHDYIEFTYVFEGSCKFVGPNKEEIMLHSGDLLLLATNTEHQLHIDNDDSIVFHISVRKSTFDRAFMMLLDGEDILAQFFRRIIYGPSPISYVLYEVNGDERIRMLQLEMYNEMQLDHKTSSIMLNVYFQWLCIYLMRNYECKVWIEDNKSQNVDMMKILKFLQDNYRHISLEEMARRFNYSKTYLCKIIKKYTGKTYGDLITGIRMQKACELLKRSKLSGGEIASAVGYSDASSFYRVFKNTYNMTPANYQQKYMDSSE